MVLKYLEGPLVLIKDFSRPNSFSIIFFACETGKYCEDLFTFNSPTGITSIKDCLKLLENKDKSILSVTKIEHTPGIVVKNKFKFIKNEKRRRQDRRSYYIENGNFYIVNKKYFLKEKKIVDQINNYYLTSITSSIDINSYEDYKIAKKIYNK